METLKKIQLKNRSIVSCDDVVSRVGCPDRAKNQPICQGIGRFLAICFDHDIDEKSIPKVSLFFVTTPDLHHHHSHRPPRMAGRCGKICHDLSAYCGSMNRVGCGETK
jgi:hypothetical protein